jgi:hypothetical protein
MAYYAGMTLLPAKLLQTLGALDRPQRELALALLGLLLGLVLMPLLVWVAGVIALGPYANGGFGALFGDFLRGLAEGSFACWLVLAGPYLVLTLVRLLRLALQGIASRA